MIPIMTQLISLQKIFSEISSNKLCFSRKLPISAMFTNVYVEELCYVDLLFAPNLCLLSLLDRFGRHFFFKS